MKIVRIVRNLIMGETYKRSCKRTLSSILSSRPHGGLTTSCRPDMIAKNKFELLKNENNVDERVMP